MARVRIVQRLVCNECENQIIKCSLCGYYFKDNDKIECISDGLKHYCPGCLEE